MRVGLPALLGLYFLPSLSGVAAEQKFYVELNSAETAESRCRLNFVVQNKSDAALDSMKLDLERIPFKFEHSLHVRKSSYILAG